MAGLAPFTLLSCDKLPGNGRLLRAGVLDFAARVDPALARWIAEALMRRFADPFLAHETFQIAMDGSVKLPQRIFDPAQEADDLRPFAFATAAWMRHVSGRTHDTPPYAWRDPLAGRLTGLQGMEAEALYDALSAHIAIPPRLRAETLPRLAAMMTRPMAAVVAEAALRPPPGRR